MKTVIAILGALFCVFLAVMLCRDYRKLHRLQSDASVDEDVLVNHRPAWIGLALMIVFITFGILCLLFSVGILDDVVMHLTEIKNYGISGGV